MDKWSKKRRIFSVAFKKEKVELILSKKMTIRVVSNLYNVSYQAVHLWVQKYGGVPKGQRMVIENESEASKSLALAERVRDLEAALGRKSMEAMYMRSVIDAANVHFKCDIEKKLNCS